MSLRILLADDHSLVRAGFRSLLSAVDDLEIVGEASNGADALQMTTELKPDIVLMDISMPGPSANGIQITRQIRQRFPEIRVLMLTMHEDQGLLREAIRAGASGYILKRAGESELISAIRAVASGELYVHPEMVRALLSEEVSSQPIRKSEVDALSPRELEVLRLIVHGYTNQQMAQELNISVRTVESHRANLMSKLHLQTRVELVRYARSAGIVK